MSEKYTHYCVGFQAPYQGGSMGSLSKGYGYPVTKTRVFEDEERAREFMGGLSDNYNQETPPRLFGMVELER